MSLNSLGNPVTHREGEKKFLFPRASIYRITQQIITQSSGYISSLDMLLNLLNVISKRAKYTRAHALQPHVALHFGASPAKHRLFQIDGKLRVPLSLHFFFFWLESLKGARGMGLDRNEAPKPCVITPRCGQPLPEVLVIGIFSSEPISFTFLA